MFELPETGDHEPAEIYGRLLELPEFTHLRDWKPLVGFLLRKYPERSQGRSVIGTCSIPMAQGRVRKLFEWLLEDKLGYFPVFLYTLDADFWAVSTPKQREILMYHEMNHAGISKDQYGADRFHRDTGEPMWAIVGHDVEEFTATVARYGAYTDELAIFRDAMVAHADE